jgi:hypothetical protein
MSVRRAPGPVGGAVTTSGCSRLRSVRSISARRAGDPSESRGEVKTRAAAVPQTEQATAAVAAPIAQRVSVVPCSGHR